MAALSHAWKYAKNVPVMELDFDLPGSPNTRTLILQVDTGFYGDFPTLLIDDRVGKLLAVRSGPPIPNQDAHQNVIWHPTIWTRLNMPSLNLRTEILAVCYSVLPGEHQGMLGLAFLDTFFDEWGSRVNPSGMREFFIRRENA